MDHEKAVHLSLSGIEKDRVRERRYRFCAMAGLALLLVCLNVVCLARGLNHDEDQFVAAGALLAHGGFLPYRDYPYFHLPNLVFVFGALFSAIGHPLLTARVFNLVCADLLLILIFATVVAAARSLGPKRWLIAAGWTAVLILNPVFRDTTGRAWNHDLAMLCSVAALLSLFHGLEPGRSRNWLILSGTLLGLAVGTRLTFLLLLPPFLLVSLLFPSSKSGRRGGTLAFLAGFALSMLPTLLLFLDAPRALFFDNFSANEILNIRYRLAQDPMGVSLPAKFDFFLRQILLASPSNLFLGGAFFLFACRFPRGDGDYPNESNTRKRIAFLLIVPFALLAAVLPTPSYRHYYAEAVPFLILGAALGSTTLGRTIRGRMIVPATLMIALFVGVAEFAADAMGGAHGNGRGANPGLRQIDRVGRQIHRLAPSGPVLTLAPIYPLEGGVSIYKEFCTGPFAWRIGDYAADADRVRYDFIGEKELEGYLKVQPAAILTGIEKNLALDVPLTDYAHRHHYTETILAGGAILWLPSK